MATTRNPFTGNAQDERFVIQTADYLSVNWADFPGLTERTRYGHHNLADAVSEVIEMAKGFDNAQFRIIRRTEEMVMTPLLSLNLRPLTEQGIPNPDAGMPNADA